MSVDAYTMFFPPSEEILGTLKETFSWKGRLFPRRSPCDIFKLGLWAFSLKMPFWITFTTRDIVVCASFFFSLECFCYYSKPHPLNWWNLGWSYLDLCHDVPTQLFLYVWKLFWQLCISWCMLVRYESFLSSLNVSNSAYLMSVVALTTAVLLNFRERLGSNLNKSIWFYYFLPQKRANFRPVLIF